MIARHSGKRAARMPRAYRRADRADAWRHAVDAFVGWAALAAGLLIAVMLVRCGLAWWSGRL